MASSWRAYANRTVRQLRVFNDAASEMLSRCDPAFAKIGKAPIVAVEDLSELGDGYVKPNSFLLLSQNAYLDLHRHWFGDEAVRSMKAALFNIMRNPVILGKDDEESWKLIEPFQSGYAPRFRNAFVLSLMCFEPKLGDFLAKPFKGDDTRFERIRFLIYKFLGGSEKGLASLGIINNILHEKFAHGYLATRTNVGRSVCEYNLSFENEQTEKSLRQSMCLVNEGFAVWLATKFMGIMHSKDRYHRSLGNTIGNTIKEEMLCRARTDDIYFDPHACGYSLFFKLEKAVGGNLGCIVKAAKYAADVDFPDVSYDEIARFLHEEGRNTYRADERFRNIVTFFTKNFGGLRDWRCDSPSCYDGCPMDRSLEYVCARIS